MGEVYRARDTRLGRDVAIKILSEHLSANPDLKQRFEREARAISALNHPRICTLHDIGNQDGIDFLVMEYMEGETLAQRLKRGRLPMKDTVKFGIEICEALDKAHRAMRIQGWPGPQATDTTSHLAQATGEWRYGKSYAFPHIPTSQRRLRTNVQVQKTGSGHGNASHRSIDLRRSIDR